jgi:nicotinic acid mononucleotide adenylyltransferase
MVRDRLAAERPIGDLVPPAVEDYIREHGLYA